MTKIYRSAMGKSIDIDQILLRNETTISIGNMKVNARGDELGPGGKIIKTRDQVMKEYYALNTPVAADPMDQMQPDEPSPTAAKPQAAVAEVVAEAIAEVKTPVVAAPPRAPIPPAQQAEPVIISPDSGLDDIDEGPSVAPVEQLSLEEVLKQPTSIAPLTPAFVPTKDIAAGTPATPVPAAPAIDSDTSILQEPAASVARGAPMRGSLAEAVAAATTVTQVEKLPPKKANGIQRF